MNVPGLFMFFMVLGSAYCIGFIGVPDYGISSNSVEPVQAQGVTYADPQNEYEESVEELNDYVPVYECDIKDEPGKTIHGRAYFQGSGPDRVPQYVEIENKNPWTVYHEEAHVLHPNWSEKQCNDYAYGRGVKPPYVPLN